MVINMYYIKNFLLYSLSGFIMESTLFKIVSCPKKSGIFYGPMTAVYGVGIIAILLLNKYFFIISITFLTHIPAILPRCQRSYHNVRVLVLHLDVPLLSKTDKLLFRTD